MASTSLGEMPSQATWWRLCLSVAGSSLAGGGGGGLEGGVSSVESEALQLTLTLSLVAVPLPFRPNPELLLGPIRSDGDLLFLGSTGVIT